MNEELREAIVVAIRSEFSRCRHECRFTDPEAEALQDMHHRQVALGGGEQLYDDHQFVRLVRGIWVKVVFSVIAVLSATLVGGALTLLWKGWTIGRP